MTLRSYHPSPTSTTAMPDHRPTPSVPQSIQPLSEMPTPLTRQRIPLIGHWQFRPDSNAELRASPHSQDRFTHRNADQSEDAPANDAATDWGWWAQIERVWLDLTTPPLLQRAAQDGWTPNVASDYCSCCGRSHDQTDASPRSVPKLESFLDQQADATLARCVACEGKRPPWARLVRLGAYRPPLSHWVQEIKFGRWRSLGQGLGVWLGESLASAIAQERAQPGSSPALFKPPMVVPIPMSFRRRISRGIDHTLTLSRGVCKGLVASEIDAQMTHLLRRAHRPSQLSVALSHRPDNMKGAFSITRASRLEACQGRLLILVDDVATSGATLVHAARTLQSSWQAWPKPLRPKLWVALAAVAQGSEARDQTST